MKKKIFFIVGIVICLGLCACSAGDAVGDSNASLISSSQTDEPFNEPKESEPSAEVSFPSSAGVSEESEGIEKNPVEQEKTDTSISLEKKVEFSFDLDSDIREKNGRKGNLIFYVPLEWEEYERGFDYDGEKLIEISYSSSDRRRERLSKFENVVTKEIGNREFWIYSEEYPILVRPGMVPGLKETKVSECVIWSYCFFDGEDAYRIALFQDQSQKQVEIADFENVLSKLEVVNNDSDPSDGQGFKQLEVDVPVYGAEKERSKRIIFHCPLDWESYDGDIDRENKKLVDLNCSTPEHTEDWLASVDDKKEVVIGGRTFQVFSEEYGILEQEPKKQVFPYVIWRYYFFDGELYYRFDFFQNQQTMPVTLEEFEEVLATMEIKEN